VGEHLTHNSEIEGLNSATGTERDRTQVSNKLNINKRLGYKT
jgi:hypothetical protein